MGLSLIFISHDLGVVKHIADRVAVMYLGRVVELGPAESVIGSPVHPYTRALVSAVPHHDPEREKDRRRIVLPGDPPSPLNPPPGCAFHPRCIHAKDTCRAAVPALRTFAGREVACVRAEDIGGVS
jgi:oligopeptide/dipeptide ABC transporter ATP-binding protein